VLTVYTRPKIKRTNEIQIISVKSKPKGTAQTRFKGIISLKLNTIHTITDVIALPFSFD
jgi:hypothetical protein